MCVVMVTDGDVSSGGSNAAPSSLAQAGVPRRPEGFAAGPPTGARVDAGRSVGVGDVTKLAHRVFGRRTVRRAPIW